jgi:hypothetical protein
VTHRSAGRELHPFRRGLSVAILGACALAVGPWHGTPAAAGPVSQWYATDLHVHSTVSADARPDLGILTKNARAAGFNAIFLTDHNQASDFSISTRSANNAFFDAPTHDDLTRWTAVGSGVTQVSSPVHSGTASTHLTSSGSGEQFVWSVRGPNFRAGTGSVTTTFSIYPTSLAGRLELLHLGIVGRRRYDPEYAARSRGLHAGSERRAGVLQERRLRLVHRSCSESDAVHADIDELQQHLAHPTGGREGVSNHGRAVR